MKITGITKQGFHYSVDDAVGDDWELIEILSEMNNDEYLSVVPFAKLVAILSSFPYNL